MAPWIRCPRTVAVLFAASIDSTGPSTNSSALSRLTPAELVAEATSATKTAAPIIFIDLSPSQSLISLGHARENVDLDWLRSNAVARFVVGLVRLHICRRVARLVLKKVNANAVLPYRFARFRRRKTREKCV